MEIREDYHAHFYYTPASRPSAIDLYARARQLFGRLAIVKKPVDDNIGPHLRPMFEIAFRREHLDIIRDWLMMNRADHPVLLHPVVEDEVLGHSELATWFGEKLPLDFSKLRTT